MPRSPTTLTEWTVADLLDKFGPIPARRIRHDPPPGTATEDDLLRINEAEERLYELVDGTLVEKVMGYAEGFLALRLGRLVGNFVEAGDLGLVAGADATVRLMAGLVRIPDLSFVAWERLPKREVPREPIPDLVPDLAAEVLSEGNTQEEMERKLKEYFLTGVRLVWLIDPNRRSVQVYTAPDRRVVLTETETLEGGDVLPGLAIPLQELFARLPREPEPRRRRDVRPRREKKKKPK
jgi:Uma2 family endonuclease